MFGGVGVLIVVLGGSRTYFLLIPTSVFLRLGEGLTSLMLLTVAYRSWGTEVRESAIRLRLAAQSARLGYFMSCPLSFTGFIWSEVDLETENNLSGRK